jgi:hypothetical protein
VTVLLAVLVGLVAAQLLAVGGYGMYRLGRRSQPAAETLIVEEPPIVVDEPSLTPDPDPDFVPEASWMRGLVMETVIVHTDAGLSYEGLLVLEHEKGLILRNPKLLDEQRSPTPMAGELWLSKEKVHGVQTKPVELVQLPAAS